ncbi:MAG: U32 family peptidase [Desulfobulbus sp.]|nr:U32 family peptidase [Desulfobulbus sp.]
MNFTAPATIELLAPAGTVAAFGVALQEGADAVYVGAPGLNARALSRDFTFGEIAGMTEAAHGQGKKIYLAMNSLMKENEVPLALESLQRFAAIAPDALIIQDLGLLYLARRYFPELKLHASTLMTVNTAMAASYFQQMGFERVVLARELSLEEIRAIHAQSGVELEIFVHGAMCFSYSGLCRFSSLHGGKSSLRGQCVQPCRRRYDWVASGKTGGRSPGGKKGGYLFSMNDLCGLDELAAIRDTGVVSLKIEGRLKSVAYVRNVVRAYRLALDGLDQPPHQQKALLEEAQHFLDAAMGRKRSSGFFIGGREDRIILPNFSGSSGELIGKVLKIERSKGPAQQRGLQLQVTLQAPLEVGDRLRLYEERSGDRKSFTLRAMEYKGRRAEKAGKGQSVSILVGDVDAGGFQKASHGLLFRVDVSGRTDKERSPMISKIATREAPDCHPGVVRKQLAELGMLAPPKAISGKRGPEHGRTQNRTKGSHNAPSSPQWWLKVASLESARQRFPFKVSRVILDLQPANVERALQAGSKPGKLPFTVVWSLPPVLLEEFLPWVRKAIRALRLQDAVSFQISHIGQLALFATNDGDSPLPPLEIFGEYSCNLLNIPAILQCHKAGLSGVQFSLETDRDTLQKALMHRATLGQSKTGEQIQVGLYVYGRPPLFSARLDAPHFQGQRSFVSGRGERYYIDRRPEAVYAYSHNAFSLLAHVDELSRMGLDYFVVDVSHGAVKKESMAVTSLIHGRGELPENFSGNYDGTLA